MGLSQEVEQTVPQPAGTTCYESYIFIGRRSAVYKASINRLAPVGPATECPLVGYGERISATSSERTQPPAPRQNCTVSTSLPAGTKILNPAW